MTSLHPYDGILLASFGGPEAPEEVRPFLERVTAGKGVPSERLDTVAEHYLARGGVSPINAENRALLAALRAELDRRGIDVPLLWGNRNAAPFLVDALTEARDLGLTRVVVLLTSAWSSYSSCRQYREDLAAAAAQVPGAPEIDKVAPYGHTRGFGETTLALIREAWVQVSDPQHAHLLFVTHSVPTAMNDTSGPGDGPGGTYALEHLTLAREILARLATDGGEPPAGGLAFCSRSGPPQMPWLEPDVNDRLRELAAEGVRDVVLAPIGFVADHMEVVQDLDTEAAATAAEVGIRLRRVPTVRSDPRHVSGLVDLLEDRAREARAEQVRREPWPTGGRIPPSVCPAGCCPNLRTVRPALCGAAGDA